MNHPIQRAVGGVGVGLAIALAASAVPLGQAAPSSSGPGRFDVPRTPDGHPDLQGMYYTATITTLERPEEFGNRLVLTADEVARLEGQNLERNQQRNSASRADRTAPAVGGNVGGYNNFWIDSERGTRVIVVAGESRSSLIIDPPNGRMPPQTPEAQRRNAVARGTVVRPTSDAPENQETAAPGAFDDVELRPLGERCLLGFGSTSGPPALPVLYNNYKQIVQTRDYVMILNEMVHDVRVIRLNSQHLPPTIRRWNGDSVGRWEGDTLVVETTNFSDKTRFRGASANMKVTERFMRVDARTILYRFTVEDPSTWTRPWTAEYPWNATDSQLYEYACHEGNHAMVGIMKGERLLDAERAAKPR